MFNQNTDAEWERFGRKDPYFGVLADAKFHAANLTDANREEFFRTGVEYVDDVLRKIRQHLDPDFTSRRVLDFGCGVGRLVIPFAKVAQEVTGVDVSDSMLREARRNCEARSVGNVTLVKSDDTLSRLNGTYDLVHSVMVFQHIPVSRGERIFEALLAHLEENGIGVVHFAYAKPQFLQRVSALAKRYVPFSGNLINLVKGRAFSTPQSQMNSYDINRLILILQQAKVVDCYTEFTDHGGHLGVILYFRKPKVQ